MQRLVWTEVAMTRFGEQLVKIWACIGRVAALLPCACTALD